MKSKGQYPIPLNNQHHAQLHYPRRRVAIIYRASVKQKSEGEDTEFYSIGPYYKSDFWVFHKLSIT